MKINGIETIEQANAFLHTYLTRYNNQFSLINNNIPHVYETLDNSFDLNMILAIVSHRTFDRGSALKYQNKFFQAYDKDGKLINIKNKTKAIIRSFDQNLYCLVDKDYYKLVELDSHQKHSENFDVGVKKEKRVYAVPDSHPWKRASYEKMLERVANRAR